VIGPVFVTGGTGFLGTNLLRGLRDAGIATVALARDRTGGETVGGYGARPVIGDLFEADVLTDGMRSCDVVFHVAGVNAMCESDPTEMFRVNVEGTRRVVRAAAAAGVGRVVVTSSAAALGEARGTVGSETTPHRGSYLSDYERSKHEGEIAAFEEAERHGVDLVAVNPSSVQGPGRTRGSAELLLRAVNSRFPVLVDTTVSIVDVDDCTAGHIAAATRGAPGERYVLNGASIEVRDLVGLFREVTGAAIHPIVVPRRVAAALGTPAAAVFGRSSRTFCPEMVRTLLHGHRYDGSRATRDLGVTYTPLVETLRRTIRWYVDFGFVRRPLPRMPG
jgi:dihydroflavonol-4-reductase